MLDVGAHSPRRPCSPASLEVEQERRLASLSPPIAEPFQTEEAGRSMAHLLLHLSIKGHTHATCSKDHTIWRNFARHTHLCNLTLCLQINDNAKANESSKKAPNRPTIKFADPNAVRALNTALLVADYNIKPNYAEILPRNALVPPVPGRADYIHHLADLLGEQDGNIPEGASVRGLDIGTGASVIYPLVATSTYGWSMVASEINLPSLQSAQRIIEENTLENLIDLRQQESEENIFDGIFQPKEEIDFVMCNPPFFPSLEVFQAENARKIKGLARGGMNKRSRSISKANEADQKNEASNNFGGTDSELWCEGGEVSFVQRMIDESKSKKYRHKILWCTSLVSRESNCERIEKYLRTNAHPEEVRRISFGAGKKSASILAWTFLNKDKRREWASKWR